MSKTITSAREIPDAYGYVTATDAFMSGWGGAEGARNVIVLPVTAAEWPIVEANTRARSEMRRVRFTRTKPRPRAGVVLSLFDPAEARRWYTPGGFSMPDLCDGSGEVAEPETVDDAGARGWCRKCDQPVPLADGTGPAYPEPGRFPIHITAQAVAHINREG